MKIALDNFLLYLPQKLSVDAAMEEHSNLISHLFENAPKPIKHITNHLKGASGKNVRASLLFAAAVDEDELVPKDTVLAAVAVELFHLATLIHDDIIDEADYRRGIPSVHVQFSKKEAVICGDYLLCIALSTVSRIYEPYKDFIHKFSAAVEGVCLGELRQHANNFNTDITFYEYLRTIKGKTAALFHVAAYSGALIGSAPDHEVQLIGKFGTYIGMLFQILDDVKDYIMDEKEALKPTQSDLNSGVINLPLLMVFLKDSNLRKRTKQALGNPIEVAALINNVRKSGGVSDSIGIAKKYIKKSQNILNKITGSKKTKELERLLLMQIEMTEKLERKVL